MKDGVVGLCVFKREGNWANDALAECPQCFGPLLVAMKLAQQHDGIFGDSIKMEGLDGHRGPKAEAAGA